MSAAGVVGRGVRVHLGGRAVVDGVDVEARAGEVTAIVGPNGSGKTSLLRALAGLVPSEGEIRAGGLDVRVASPSDRARAVAYLPQASSLGAMLSVAQVVALGRFASRPGLFGSSREDAAHVEDALARVNLAGFGQRAYPQLSGGQKRLVLIARALATGARTLLLDEPTASLDIEHALRSFELLGGLARDGYAVLLVLHDLDDVLRHARSAVLLDRGRVRAAGPPTAPEFARAAQQTYAVKLVPGGRIGFELTSPATE